MRRQKIKLKYRNEINLHKDNNCNVNNDIDFKLGRKKIIDGAVNFFKASGLILLMLFWDYLPLVFLLAFGISYSNFSEMMKIIYLTLCDITFLGFLIFIFRKDFFLNFKEFFNKKFFDNFRLSLKYWGIGVLIMIVSNIVIGLIFNGGMPNNEESVRELIDNMPLYMVLHLVIYAPIVEELIFRRGFRDAFNNKYFYIIISGMIFGGMHIISYIDNWLQILFIIPYSALGIAFASLYKKTYNIFSTISIHAFHNFLTLILYVIGV